MLTIYTYHVTFHIVSQLYLHHASGLEMEIEI